MTKLKHLSLTILCSLLLTAAETAVAGISIIVNPNSKISALSPGQAANIFLGKTRVSPNKKLLIPVDQARSSETRKIFYKKLVNKNQNQLNAYWAKQVFTGKSQPPVQLNSNEEVKLLVSDNPNMIGYIDDEAVDTTVKVILRIP